MENEQIINRNERLESIPPLNNEDLYESGHRLLPMIPSESMIPEATPELALLKEEEKKHIEEPDLRVTLPIQLPPTTQTLSEKAAIKQEENIPSKLNTPAFPIQNTTKLNFDLRKQKVARYLAKKRRRTWKKKVSYNCRREMASKRLRIKGRFVSTQQAVEHLGVDPEKIKSTDDLKNMIQSKSSQKTTKAAEKRQKKKLGKMQRNEGYNTRKKPKKQETKISIEVPRIKERIFVFHRARLDTVPEVHRKYHTTIRRSLL